MKKNKEEEGGRGEGREEEKEEKWTCLQKKPVR
jgi:hypothetical protein